MTWGQEIIRALLFAFGITEIITNLTYLVKENGMTLAGKQHGELPENVSDKKIKVKVVCMLAFGTAFFVSSLLSYIQHRYLHGVIAVTAVMFLLYGIAEALYYRYWKTFGFAFVTLLLAVCSVLI